MIGVVYFDGMVCFGICLFEFDLLFGLEFMIDLLWVLTDWFNSSGLCFTWYKMVTINLCNLTCIVLLCS